MATGARRSTTVLVLLWAALVVVVARAAVERDEMRLPVVHDDGKSPLTVKVMTWNILRWKTTARVETKDEWLARRQAVVETVKREQPDVLCLQGLRKVSHDALGVYDQFSELFDDFDKKYPQTEGFVNGTFKYVDEFTLEVNDDDDAAATGGGGGKKKTSEDVKRGVTILSRFHWMGRPKYLLLESSPLAPRRLLLHLEIDTGARTFHVFSGELGYKRKEQEFMYPKTVEWVNKQLGLKSADAVRNSHTPTVLMLDTEYYAGTKSDAITLLTSTKKKAMSGFKMANIDDDNHDHSTIDSTSGERDGHPDRIYTRGAIEQRGEVVTQCANHAKAFWHCAVVATFTLPVPDDYHPVGNHPATFTDTFDDEPKITETSEGTVEIGASEMSVGSKIVLASGLLIGLAFAAMAGMAYYLWKKRRNQGRSKEYYRPLEIDVFTIGDIKGSM